MQEVSLLQIITLLSSWTDYALGFMDYLYCQWFLYQKKTRLCKGQTISLLTTEGYNDCKWFRDGIQTDRNSTQISVNQAGELTTKASEHGITNKYLTSCEAYRSKNENIGRLILTSGSSENNHLNKVILIEQYICNVGAHLSSPYNHKSLFIKIWYVDYRFLPLNQVWKVF